MEASLERDSHPHSGRDSKVAPPSGMADCVVAAQNASRGGPSFKLHGPPTFEQKRAILEKEMTRKERTFLRAAPCPVLCTSQRIARAITSRLASGGMKAPPPIVSRIFQEVSNGLLAYNGATKMKEIPVPFAFVQFNAVLLVIFFVTCPVGIACLVLNSLEETTDASYALTAVVVIATMFTVASFTALWLIANELEDPFGDDPNDMPMVQFHHEFCDSLTYALHHSWMEIDSWTVASGDWKPAETTADAAELAVAAARRQSAFMSGQRDPINTISPPPPQIVIDR